MSAVDAGGMFAALVHDRGTLAPELTDVRRFLNPWEKAASVELRAGSPDAVDAYDAHGRVAGGSRDEMLDALYKAWKRDIDESKISLMIAADTGTVGELNSRAQADLIAAGRVAGDGVPVSGGASAAIGDEVVTRHNNRRLNAGKQWVRNGDQWRVAGSHADGSLTLQRRHGAGMVQVPAVYVREHVELAYASTAHRAQGRTVDTAHAMVSPSTTRETLYVSATRGKASNRLYVDTHYDPDPQTSHDDALESMTAKDVLAGALRNEGAEVAANEMIRREYHEAEGMEQLSAEYLTLATEAQAERFDALLAHRDCPMLTSPSWPPVRAGDRCSQGYAMPKHADSTLKQACRGSSPKSLADAVDVAAVLHGRIDRWSQAAGGRRRHTGQLIAGLIPRAQGVTDPEMARALTERDQAMERRALSLAEEAIARRETWVRPLGDAPSGVVKQERWSPGCDDRGLPGPLEGRGSAPSRCSSGPRENGTVGPAQEGAGSR